MNRATSNRVISKQECLVLLGNLDLVLCSETIDSVSVSNSAPITVDGEKESSNFRRTYNTRSGHFESFSLDNYYHHQNNNGIHPSSRKFKVPHYVGINGQPTYPVCESYAKSVLITYKPWRNEKHNKDRHWIWEFNLFIESSDCPKSVKIAYERVKQRYLSKMLGYEPVSKEVDHSGNTISDEDAEIIDMAGLHAMTAEKLSGEPELVGADRGYDYDWSALSCVVSKYHFLHHVSFCNFMGLTRNNCKYFRNVKRQKTFFRRIG